MAETLKGKAVVWGVQGISTSIGASDITTAIILSAVTYSRTCETRTIANGQGATVGQVFYDLRHNLRLTVVPANGVDISDTEGTMETATCAPGTVVTIVDSKGTTTLDGANTGKYLCLSSSQNRTNDGYVTVELELINYVDNDVSATVNA